MKNLHLYDFGIFLELQPDEEEKQMLENNIQMALQQQMIALEDAIDIREIKNIKLANQMLKIRRKEKMANDQKMAQENIRVQNEANVHATRAAAQMEVQKNQAMTQMQEKLEETKSLLETEKMNREVLHKKELMALEFQYNMQLKGIEVNGVKQREKEKEDRKDERTKIQATQQSEMIEQRKTGKPPKNFESADDTLGGFNLGAFDPR
jgi:hypothetical protein